MFEAWLAKGLAPPVPAVLKLYKKLITSGLKIVFISGTSESQRDVRIDNLKKAGYYKWEKLVLNILKIDDVAGAGKRPIGEPQHRFTRRRRGPRSKQPDTDRILGNMGDQWSDITGTHVGNRTFKLPNPMFYIS
ncbi:hypothetical protein RJ639_003540 [Escallonia herrerae]|uniref:Acid phosphatase n=1 Tax=Escallonia herrerae TaxID=1293975 RepID=A0AA89AY39_9ASTE|nr:hypothetical protein RJ639_003540 [Escallonia herrerae]